MAKIVLLGFGALALAMGGVCGWIGWTSRLNAARAAGLRPLDAPGLAAAEIGAEGYVEGALSQVNPSRFRDFVLYYRSVLYGFEGQGGERRPIWKQVERVLPPVWLDVREGKVRISGDYRVVFRGRDPAWTSLEELEPGTTERYEGLAAGHPVTAVGRVAEDEDGRALRAETLASGTFEDYLSGERGSATFGLVAGAVLGLAGIVLVTIGVEI